MKAAIYSKFGPPEVLHLQELDVPTPRANEVLVRIHATSVVKEDPDMRASPGFNGLLRPRHPILGQELAGEIVFVGATVTRFKPGDPVFGIDLFGAYAEYKCMPEDGALARKPANMTWVEAASIPNGALTALPFLRDQGRVQSGQKVLIYGASGSVGAAAVQLAKYYGAIVTGVCSTPNLAWVKALGADTVIDYTRKDFARNGERYDIIFDTIGKRSVADCKGALTDTGTFLATVPTPATMLQAILTARSRGKKARFAATGLRPAQAKATDLVFLTALIEAGKFKPVIDRAYPLEEIADAHRYVQKGHKKGNVVITV